MLDKILEKDIKLTNYNILKIIDINIKNKYQRGKKINYMFTTLCKILKKKDSLRIYIYEKKNVMENK